MQETQGIKELMYAPFGDIPTRKGRGGVYSYVRWQDVADRMNQIFGVHWSSEVAFQEVVGKNVIVRVSVCVKDPVTGERFCQEGFGGAVNDESQEAGNAFKSAYSKALKDACKRWGVGLFLEEDADATETTTPTGYSGKEFGIPGGQRPVVVSTPIAPVTPVTPTVVATAAPPQAVTALPEVKSSMTLSVVDPEPVVAAEKPFDAVKRSLPTPPGMSMGGRPSMPTPGGMSFPSTAKMPTMAATEAAMSKLRPISSSSEELISDVQKAALNSIVKLLDSHGSNYDMLVQEAFALNGLNRTDVPAPDKLTYQEAVYVVKYGNDKFRKH